VHESTGTICLYDTASGKLSASFPVGFPREYIRFDPTGKRLAASDHRGGRVLIYEVPSGKVQRELRNMPFARGLAWSSDGRLLAVAWRNRVSVFDANSGRQVSEMTGHQNEALRVAFSPRGYLLASGGWDNMARLWDPFTGRQLLAVGGCRGVQFSADGGQFGFSGAGSETWTWGVTSGGVCRAVPDLRQLGVEGPRYGVSFSPDGRLMAVAGDVGTQILDATTLEGLALLPTAHTFSAHFTPDLKMLVTSGEGGFLQWPIAAQPTVGGTRVTFGPVKSLVPSRGQFFNRSDMSPDGRLVAVSHGGNHAHVVDLQTHREI